MDIFSGLKAKDEALLFGFTFDREDVTDALSPERLQSPQAASGAREQLRVLQMALRSGLEIRTVQGFPLEPLMKKRGGVPEQGSRERFTPRSSLRGRSWKERPCRCDASSNLEMSTLLAWRHAHRQL